MPISPKACRTRFITRLAKVADLKVISRTSTQNTRARLITYARSPNN